jgi:hypothetical protein
VCDPLSLAAASTAVSGASSVMGFVGQGQAAAANARSANYAYAGTYDTEQQREAQIDQQQAGNTVQAAIDRTVAEGRVSASASSFGGDRQTAIGEVNSVANQNERALGTENINSENQRTQVATDLTGAELERQSQINRVQPESPLALGVGLAGDAAQGAATYSKLGGRF